METNKGELLIKCRKCEDVIKTGRGQLARDRHGGVDVMDKASCCGSSHQEPAYRPCGDRYGGGVNISQALIGNLGTCMPMQREESKWKNHEDQKPKRHSGAERPVVVMNLLNGRGAKGLCYPALITDQPEGKNP